MDGRREDSRLTAGRGRFVSDFVTGTVAFAGFLRAASVLHDADGAGAFFQRRSRPWGEGQFFGIVQRTGGRAAYGAPIAPFRIVAHKRVMRPRGMPRIWRCVTRPRARPRPPVAATGAPIVPAGLLRHGPP